MRTSREWRNRPFEWGVSDCAQMAIATAVAISGENPLPDLQPYSTGPGALLAMQALGGTTMQDVMDQRFARVALLGASRGDWVLRTSSGVDGALGVVLGRHAAFMGQGGVVLLPAGQASRAWRVV